jgi:hypothetical protein
MFVINQFSNVNMHMQLFLALYNTWFYRTLYQSNKIKGKATCISVISYYINESWTPIVIQTYSPVCVVACCYVKIPTPVNLFVTSFIFKPFKLYCPGYRSYYSCNNLTLIIWKQKLKKSYNFNKCGKICPQKRKLYKCAFLDAI